MTGSGIQAWVLCLIGIRSASAYQEIATMLEMIHVLSNSYLLASSGAGSSVLYGRSAIGFCRAAVIGAVGNFASRCLRHAPATMGARFSPWPSGALSHRGLDSINGHRHAGDQRSRASSDLEHCCDRTMERRL
jgi:hypothetical protein